MELTEEAVATIFRADKPYPEAWSSLLRDRGEAFVETMMYEVECFEGEGNLWPEAMFIGGL